MGDKILYDIHCHTYNLTHPGFLGYINRFFLKNSLSFQDLLKARYIKAIRILLLRGKIRVKLLILIAVLSLLVLLNWIVASVILPALFSDSHASPLILSLLVVLKVLIILFNELILIYFILKLFKSFSGEKFKRIFNLLSLIENDIGRQLLYIELDMARLDPVRQNFVDDIKAYYRQKFSNKKENREQAQYLLNSLKKEKTRWENSEKELEIYCSSYNKYYITPLIMDFGYRDFSDFTENIHYDTPPQKAVVKQVVDLYNGKIFYENESHFNFLEIHPFLGINTQNYELGIRIDKAPKLRIPGTLENKLIYIDDDTSIILIMRLSADAIESLKEHNKDNPDNLRFIDNISKNYDDQFIKEDFLKDYPIINTVPKMLTKYFVEREKTESEKRYITIEETNQIPHGFFVGIKVYPPLGFHPWPKSDPERKEDPRGEKYEDFKIEEREKVRYLYRFCISNNIPITTHCSDSGWIVSDVNESLKQACPWTWDCVLRKFPNLKLNFAHFGAESGKSKKLWRTKILNLMNQYR
ncbi:amidohydrolase family protein, partial [Acidobacteriota bacterium]